MTMLQTFDSKHELSSIQKFTIEKREVYTSRIEMEDI